MKTPLGFWAACLAAGICSTAHSQIYDTNNVVVQTFVGSGFSGYYDGQGTQTMFNNPSSVVADTSSNLFVLDTANFRVRKITPDGTVSTFAGGGQLVEGYGTNVSLGYSFGAMTIDHSNALWISASSGYLLRIGPDAYVSRTALGAISSYSFLCADSHNNLYFSTWGQHQIMRYRTNGVLEVFAGSGNQGSADGNGIFTSFSYPRGLAIDAADNIYVWDSDTHIFRRINQNRDVVTIAGSGTSDVDGVAFGASFSSIAGMCVDNVGNLILACSGSVRKMTPATNVMTLAGSFGQYAYTNGPGNLTRFNQAAGVWSSQGMVFVADVSNQRIRNITFNPAPQLVAAGNLNLETHPMLRITGVVGRTYRIESSANMTNWNVETSILLTASPYLWMDTSPVAQKKFYRAFLLP